MPIDPAMWQTRVPTRVMSASSSRCVSSLLAVVSKMVLCVWVTPLGLLVLPEVKRIKAG